jgi:predicted MFS family arabinose efflux permease
LPLGLLVVGLVLAGMASAASTPAGGRLVLLAFPRERRGIALGVRQTGVPIGGLVAAALLPVLAHAYGWRWSLAVAGGITALSVLPLVLAGTGPSEAQPARMGPWNPFRDRTVLLLALWGCLLVSGQYALVAFFALDLNRGAGLALATASLLLAVAQAFGIGWCGAAASRYWSWSALLRSSRR